MAKTTKIEAKDERPLLMTAHQMSKVSGIGENTLRRLMENRELDYLQVGSHRLLRITAIEDYYERNKVSANSPSRPHEVAAPSIGA